MICKGCIHRAVCIFSDEFGTSDLTKCKRKLIVDITPDTPNYKTEAENTAFLQGFNVAVKKMRGEV